MAKFNANEADNYGGGNGGSFFTLKNDKDTARVRFLYGSPDELQGDAVHKVTVGTRQDGSENTRYVNCLRSYNEPLDKCPFCAAQLKVTPRFFIKLYNEDAGECQIWERSKSYLQKLGSLAGRYNPLYNKVIEIERNGKSGDMHTDYAFYPCDDGGAIDISDEKYDCPDPVGTIILDKSADEMNYYLDNGRFPEGSNSGSNSKSSEDLPFTPQRRTPSGGAPTRRAF